jgi:hypothetical protein
MSAWVGLTVWSIGFLGGVLFAACLLGHLQSKVNR